MLDLPETIAAYFDARPDATADVLGAIFSADAVVRDEARVHRGLNAIRTWRIDTMRRTPFVARPLSTAQSDGIVTCDVSGAFPGSPIRLDHRFSLRDGRIVELQIG